MSDRATFTTAERSALAIAGLLLLAAAALPCLVRALSPSLHARWWFVHGGRSVETDAGWSTDPTWTGYFMCGPSPIGDRPWFERAPFTIDRWLELHGGHDADGGRPHAEPRCVGFEPPPADPWGNAWQRRQPRSFVWHAPGSVLINDPYGGQDPTAGSNGLVWSSGPDGRWEWGYEDDILIDCSPLEVALVQSGPALLALVAASIGLAILLARRPRADLPLLAEALVITTIAAAVVLPLGGIMGSWREWLPLGALERESDTPGISLHVRVYGALGLAVLLGVAWLRLSRRALSAAAPTATAAPSGAP